MSISPLVSQSHDTVNSRHCDMTTPFWQTQSLEQMTPEEWESLCDGCGRCCLQKLEDEETGEVHNTSLACQLLDIHSCRCSDYEHRKEKVPQCLKLTADEWQKRLKPDCPVYIQRRKAKLAANRELRAEGALTAAPFNPIPVHVLILLVRRGMTIKPITWRSLDHHKERLPAPPVLPTERKSRSIR